MLGASPMPPSGLVSTQRGWQVVSFYLSLASCSTHTTPPAQTLQWTLSALWQVENQNQQQTWITWLGMQRFCMLRIMPLLPFSCKGDRVWDLAFLSTLRASNAKKIQNDVAPRRPPLIMRADQKLWCKNKDREKPHYSSGLKVVHYDNSSYKWMDYKCLQRNHKECLQYWNQNTGASSLYSSLK